MVQFATNAGASAAVSATSGGKTYGYNNLGTSPQVVALANPSRVSITFHNPGPLGIFVAPAVVQGLNVAPTTLQNQNLNPSLTALGGCFYIYPNGGQITLTGECQGAYQAFASGGANNALTVMESNV